MSHRPLFVPVPETVSPGVEYIRSSASILYRHEWTCAWVGALMNWANWVDSCIGSWRIPCCSVLKTISRRSVPVSRLLQYSPACSLRSCCFVNWAADAIELVSLRYAGSRASAASFPIRCQKKLKLNLRRRYYLKVLSSLDIGICVL